MDTNGTAEAVEMPKTRRKPGERIIDQANKTEARLREQLGKVAEKRQAARDKATGKHRAISAVTNWLDKLNTTELRAELELHALDLDRFEDLEQAVGTLVEHFFQPLVTTIVVEQDSVD